MGPIGLSLFDLIAGALIAVSALMGYQRGAAFKDEINGVYATRLVAPMDEGKLKPSSEIWKYLNMAHLDASPLLLFAMTMGVRPLMQGLSIETPIEREAPTTTRSNREVLAMVLLFVMLTLTIVAALMVGYGVR